MEKFLSPENEQNNFVETKLDADPKPEYDEDINPDEIFRKAGIEIQENEVRAEIIQIVEQWFAEKESQFKEKLTGFGMSEKDINLKLSVTKSILFNELRTIGQSFSDIKKKLPEIKDQLKKTADVESVYSWLEVSSPLALLILFKRKLTGDINEQDRKILAIIDHLIHNQVKGSYNSITEELTISFFNDSPFEDWNKTLTHELTHCGLSHAVPEATDISFNQSLKARTTENNRTNQVAINSYLRLLLAIDESAAHLAEGRSPSYKSYANKISPRTFAMIYEALKNITDGKDKKEADQIFVKIYKEITSRWHEDITLEEVAGMIIDIKNNKIIL